MQTDQPSFVFRVTEKLMFDGADDGRKNSPSLVCKSVRISGGGSGIAGFGPLSFKIFGAHVAPGSMAQPPNRIAKMG